MAAPDIDDTGMRNLIPIEGSGHSGSRVSAYLVRLTDSSLRALKASLESGDQGCRIEIKGDRGELIVPHCPSKAGKLSSKSSSDGGKFTFTVSDMLRDLGTDGRMDVICGKREELEDEDKDDEALGKSRHARR